MMALFGERAGPAMQTLLDRGSAALRDFDGNLQQMGGTAERIADVQMEGLQGAMLEVRSAGEGLGIAIADAGLIQWATRAAQAFAKFLRELTETSPEILRMGTVVALAAATIGPLLLAMAGGFTALSFIIRMTSATIGLLTSPIFLLMAAVVLLVTAWREDWGEIRTTTENAVKFITNQWDKLKDWWEDTQLGQSVRAFLRELKDIWDDEDHTFAQKTVQIARLTPGVRWDNGFDEGVNKNWSDEELT